MLLKNKVSPAMQMKIAGVALAIALLAQWFIHPTSAFGPDAADALRGVFIGVAIGMNLVALISIRRQRKA